MFGISAFSETSFSDLPLNNYQLVCDAGSFSLSGQNASFVYNQALSGGAGSYTITGGSATFVYNQVIYAGAFNFQWTGNSADLNVSHKLYAEAGSFALTGQDATFLKPITLLGESGAFSFVGNNASFAYTKTLPGNAGNYVFTGQEATFEYTPAPVYVVESKGGLPEEKKRKAKLKEEKESREELEAIVKREFDILDGTYQPEVVEKVKDVVIPQIKQIDLNEYNIAIAQVNALLLQAKIQAAEYESELDDEEALLMLL